jgi:hypothetical protein
MERNEKAFEGTKMGTPARSPLRTMDNLSTMPNAALPIAVRKRAKDAISGTTDMTPEDWRGLVGGLLEFFAEEAEEPEHAADAAPKTLYVNRPLKNAAPFIEWAKAAGFAKTLTASDMHVTVAFSKAPVQWPEKLDNDVTASSGGRAIKQFGEGAVVLTFEGPDLVQRWDDLKGMGATWDHPTYQPHITITYEPGDVDISKVEPYVGPLEFGPEKFAEVDTGWKDKVEHTGAQDRMVRSRLPLVFDKSVRSYDDEERLHIEETNICKACVSPYKGDEIPGWDPETKIHALGLDPDRIYQLLRPPEELERAAPTINGIQLMRKHIPVSADDHQPWDVIGSVGTTARWDDPYIKNGLTVWVAEDIDGVEKKKKFELSPGYSYVPVMAPGVFNGESFDGRMTQIKFNHLAVVDEGRQGPEICIGDTYEDMQWNLIESALEEMTAAHA